MRKICCLCALALAAGNLFAFAFGAVDITLGSGYVWYGESDVQDKLDALSDPGQIVLNTSGTYKFKIAEPVYLAFGVDTTFDFHWSGGDHVYLIDYAGLAGVQVRPGLGGLTIGVDYALGRRTDFYKLGDYAHTHSSRWGNGFKCSLLYDFFYDTEKSLRPIAGISWRRMPRGDGADNILSVFLKLTIE